MVATVLTEALHAGAFIVSEEDNFHCRDTVTIPISMTIVAGQVLGRIGVPSTETSAVAADAGNTGNGVFTLDVTAPVGASGQDGVYRVVCIAVAANSGTFAVFDPQGVEIGRVAVGATFNNQIKFVVADGATDFAVGDAFSVTVGREGGTDETYPALNMSGTDGSQIVGGVAVYPVTTDGTNTQKIAAIVRGPAQLRAADLTWPGGITAAQKAEAIEQLRSKGIILR
jgi:hypothetical protein